MALANFSVSHGTRSAFSNSQISPNAYDYIIGDLKMSCVNNDLFGWLKCDGRSLSKTTYNNLYAVLGNTYGSTTYTFNLPDCRGQVLGTVGQGSGLTNRVIGTYVGAETHTLTVPQIPAHTHTGITTTSGAHIHGSNAVGTTIGLCISDGTNTVINTDPSSGELNVWTVPRALNINNTGSTHSHAFTTDSTSGDQAHNNMQPTLFIGYTYIYSGVHPGN